MQAEGTFRLVQSERNWTVARSLLTVLRSPMYVKVETGAGVFSLPGLRVRNGTGSLFHLYVYDAKEARAKLQVAR